MSGTDSSSLKEIVRKTKRVVIKIGSSILVRPGGRLSPTILAHLVKGIAEIQKQGIGVVLVSSGAIASGMQYLGFTKKPHKISELQACASIGQPILIQHYQRVFARRKLQVAQLLLTRSDLEDRSRFLNTKHTLLELLHRGIIPIINENDTVAVDEIRVGDNDNLSALVTNVADADLLVLLTDQDGFHTADPRSDTSATRIPVVENLDGEAFSRATDTLTPLSVGGMKTKLEAAQTAARFGIPTIIANGLDPKILSRILQAESVGTLFLPRLDSLTARKHWIAHTLKPQGKLIVDDGARKAVLEAKKSLLPSGLIGLEGNFSQGDPVDIRDQSGKTFARGLTTYNVEELRRILGKKSSEIEAILGYRGPDEVIHRNDLVIL